VTRYFNVIEKPPVPANLTINTAPKKISAKANKKNASITVTIANTGEQVSNMIQLCVSAPNKKVGVTGDKCRNIVGLAGGADIVQTFKLKLKKKLKGSRANVKFTISSDGHPNRTKTVEIRQKKK